MIESWEEHLQRELEDPEFAAHFYNARQESLLELVRASVLHSVNLTGSEMNKTEHWRWDE